MPAQSANLWWPDDRAWCVATEIDFMTTYIAGTAEAIAAIVARADLEADIDEGYTTRSAYSIAQVVASIAAAALRFAAAFADDR